MKAPGGSRRLIHRRRRNKKTCAECAREERGRSPTPLIAESFLSYALSTGGRHTTRTRAANLNANPIPRDFPLAKRTYFRRRGGGGRPRHEDGDEHEQDGQAAGESVFQHDVLLRCW
jgi:hypothetical protein